MHNLIFFDFFRVGSNVTKRRSLRVTLGAAIAKGQAGARAALGKIRGERKLCSLLSHPIFLSKLFTKNAFGFWVKKELDWCRYKPFLFPSFVTENLLFLTWEC